MVSVIVVVIVSAAIVMMIVPAVIPFVFRVMAIADDRLATVAFILRIFSAVYIIVHIGCRLV